MGGAERAIAAGFFQEEIARSACEIQQRVEARQSIVVGVNEYADEAVPRVVPQPDYSRLAAEQVERVRRLKERRVAEDVRSRPAALRDVARAYRDDWSGSSVPHRARHC